MDREANSGRSITGLTIKQDKDYETTKNSDDYTGIANWQTDTKKLYQNEEESLKQVKEQQVRNNQEYDLAMAEWRSKNPGNSNTLSTDQVTQHLILGREPQATASVAYSNAATKKWVENHGWRAAGVDSQHMYVSQYNGNVHDNFATVTYSNLRNSNYTDQNGIKHNITKIVRTFSNIIPDPDTNGFSQLIIMDDPTDGFVLDGSSVDYTDTYYDEKGSIINIAPNTGFLTVASLNSNYYQNNYKDTLTGKPYEVEGILPLSATEKAYGLAGSSVTVHSDGSLYADQTNNVYGNGNPNTWNQSGHSGNWDSVGTDTTYYGAGLVSLSGTSHSFRYMVKSDGKPDWLVKNRRNPGVGEGAGAWNVMTTLIPSTPTPKRKTTTISYHLNKLNVKSLPHKSTEIHYHYDVCRKTHKIRTTLIVFDVRIFANILCEY